MAQTAVQKQKSLRIGSCRVEAGPNIGALVNLGATRENTTLRETWEVIKRMSANAGEIERGIKRGTHRAAITWNWLEIDMQNLALLRGGIDSVETVAADPVNDHAYAVPAGNWKYDKLIVLDQQNGNGAKIIPTSVEAGTDGPLVSGTDYFLAQDAAGRWGVVIMDSETVETENQTITITYDYTPAAAIKLSTGGKFVISPNVVRLTNTDEDGKKFQVTVFKAYDAEGVTLEFLPDDNGDFMATPVSLEGECDEARDAGKQLFEIRDEQGA